MNQPSGTRTAQDKINAIEDIIANHFAEEDSPYSRDYLESLLESITAVLDAK